MAMINRTEPDDEWNRYITLGEGPGDDETGTPRVPGPDGPLPDPLDPWSERLTTSTTTPPSNYDPTKDPNKKPADFPGYEWYWTETDGWRSRPSGGGSGGPGSTGGLGSKPPTLRSLGDLWTPWDAPTYGGYPDFAYEKFVDPTAEEAQNMPGFKFAVGEGIKRLGSERAARGTYIGGPTLKAIGSWVTDYGMQSYGNLRDQKLSTYNTNRNNAADAWMKNYGVSRDTFDRNYRSSYDMNQDRRRRMELEFGRDWDLYQSWLDTNKFIVGQGNT